MPIRSPAAADASGLLILKPECAGDGARHQDLLTGSSGVGPDAFSASVARRRFRTGAFQGSFCSSCPSIMLEAVLSTVPMAQLPFLSDLLLLNRESQLLSIRVGPVPEAR